MTLNPPSLLIFDLDGTLINSSVDLCNAVNAALRHSGAESLRNEEIAEFIGDGAANLVRRSLSTSLNRSQQSARSVSAEQEVLFAPAFTYFLEFYRDHKLDNTSLYPGVARSLEALRSHSPFTLMAVLTNKPERPSREICDALGVSPFFFVNYGGNSFATKKPDPEGLLKIIAEAKALQQARGRSPLVHLEREVVMIGDSDVDIWTARRAGVRSLGCMYGLAPEKLLSAEPDLTCSSAEEWPRLLLGESFAWVSSEAASADQANRDLGDVA